MTTSEATTTVTVVATSSSTVNARATSLGQRLLFGFVFLYITIPMVAVLLYSVATRWTAHILPDGYTLHWWTQTFSNSQVQSAFITSFVLGFLTAGIDILVVVPAVYWSRVRNRHIRPIVEVTAAIPFALPYLVIGFGLLQWTGIVAPGLQGTFPLLVLGYAAIAFPFVYWAVDGAMSAAGVERLSEAAETCGAAPHQIVWRVVLPNITPGVVTGGLLAFATALGEFAMVSVLASSVTTIPIWSATTIRSYSGDPGAFNELAVVTTVLFVLLFALSAGVVYWNRGRTVQLLPGAATVERREGGAQQ